MTNKKIVIELNEINPDLFEKMAIKSEAVKSIIEKGKQKFSIKDDYESDYLEPWSQWVSVHTNTPTEVHQIKHLGDIEGLDLPQLWDSEPERFGFIWGCLNSKPPINDEISYFPDPWTQSSKTNRKELKSIERFLFDITRLYV